MFSWLTLLALAIAPAPAADGLYRDPDPMAVAPQRMKMESPATLELIEATIIALPEDPRPLMQYGFAEAVAGNGDAARTAYEDALGLASTPELERHVRWSYGWAMSLVGDHAGAMGQWQQAAELHGGRPFWLPYSMALVVWRAGDPELALSWYQRAVDGFPERWGTAEGVAHYTRYWRPVQQETIREVFAAWEARQPL